MVKHREKWNERYAGYMSHSALSLMHSLGLHITIRSLRQCLIVEPDASGKVLPLFSSPQESYLLISITLPLTTLSLPRLAPHPCHCRRSVSSGMPRGRDMILRHEVRTWMSFVPWPER